MEGFLFSFFKLKVFILRWCKKLLLKTGGVPCPEPQVDISDAESGCVGEYYIRQTNVYWWWLRCQTFHWLLWADALIQGSVCLYTGYKYWKAFLMYFFTLVAFPTFRLNFLPIFFLSPIVQSFSPKSRVNTEPPACCLAVKPDLTFQPLTVEYVYSAQSRGSSLTDPTLNSHPKSAWLWFVVSRRLSLLCQSFLILTSSWKNKVFHTFCWVFCWRWAQTPGWRNVTLVPKFLHLQ